MKEGRDQESKKTHLSSDAFLLRSGFTLVEMAIVLIVIGFVMLTVLPALTALRTTSQRSLTQTNLQALMTATAAFVQANGCVPCPTPAGTIGNGFGRVRGDGSAAPVSCNGCAAPEGIPPFMSLGLPAATAHDGGGHWITMRVDPALTANFGVAPPTKPVACACATPVNGTCTATSCSTIVNGVCTGTALGCSCSPPINNTCTPLPLSLSQQGLCEPSGTGTGLLSKANSISVLTPGGSTQFAAVIFVSHGANGYGSYVASSTPYYNNINGAWLPFPYPVTCSATGGFAECNAARTTQFVNAPVVATGGDPYDDVLAFADRNTLVSMLGSNSCQTVW